MFWGLCILVLFVFFFYLYRGSVVECFETNALSLEEFNQKYDADIVGLPEGLFALGVENNQYNTYSKPLLYAETMIEYWMEYIHPSLPSKYYVLMCPMDGFDSHGNVLDDLKDRIVTKDSLDDLIGVEGGVFVSYETNEYPIFHSKRNIYAVSKNINDFTTVLLPDCHYIREHGYKDKLEEVDQNRILYKDKESICIWRGGISNGSNYNFIDPKDQSKEMGQRNYFKKLYEEGQFTKVNFEDTQTSISEQIKYKFILDIDGWSSTWSATVWKLYSGSVLLKTDSKWCQWYYDEFREWEHYVPIQNDFSDLNQKIQWCIENEEECIRITENAHKFVLEKLNWERVKKDAQKAVTDSFRSFY
jgi:hypothetical protein